jgi:hypothetical protein
MPILWIFFLPKLKKKSTSCNLILGISKESQLKKLLYVLTMFPTEEVLAGQLNLQVETSSIGKCTYF